MRPQHLDALERANEIRCARAQLKRELKAGDVLLSEILTEPSIPDWLETMRVEQLLDAVPHLQTRTIHSMLHEVPVGPTVALDRMTYRQRRALASLLARWEKRKPVESGRRARLRKNRLSGQGARAIAAHSIEGGPE